MPETVPVDTGVDQPVDLDELVADLESLVSCESPSSDHDAVRRSADVVAAVGTRLLGAAPELLDLDGVTHLRWRFGAGDRVLLLGHHDTVWPLGSLSRHPWRVEEGRIGGPGCFDMKSGVVQLLHATAGLRDRDGVTVLVTGDEELGAPTSRGLIQDEARNAGSVLCFEGSADGGALKIARKGASVYEVTVQGVAAHAGLEPALGVNATVALAEVVLELVDLADDGEQTTVTPTTATSGTSANTVPDTALLRVDVRARTAVEQQRVHDGLLALARDLDRDGRVAGVSVRRLVHHPPLEAASSARLFDLAVDVAAALGLEPVIGAEVGGASDANVAAAVGADTLDGLGAVGGGAHAPGEHVLVSALADRVRLARGLVERLLSAPPAEPRPSGKTR